MPDQDFRVYRFAAAGAPTRRTMPERLSDIISVKDWGAVGSGAGDDSAAIQSAINFCIATNQGGKVFFPPGTYPLTTHALAVGHASINCGVQLIGSGQNSTTITSSTSGFMVSGGGLAIDCLELISDIAFSNSNTTAGSGCIKLTRTNAVVTNCNADGYYAVDAASCTGARIECVQSIGPGRGPNAADAATHGFNLVGTIGIQLGDNGLAAGCRIGPYHIGFTLKGTGASCIGCAGEVNNIGIRLGWSSAGVATAFACSVDGFQSERNTIPLEMYDCQGCYISSVNNQGSDNVPDFAPIALMNWSAGIVTVTTTGNHNILDTPTVLRVDSDPAWRPPGSNPQNPCVPATITDATHFTYPLAANPTGTAPAPSGWKYPLLYSIRIRKAYECVISGIGGSHSPIMASVDLDYGKAHPSSVFTADAANAQMRNVVFENSDAPFGYRVPTAVRNLAGCKFLHCTGTQNSDYLITTVASPNGQMTFADLPGQSGVFQPRLEGQTYDIKDGNASGFGATQAGGGTGHYLVRYDGANWVRIG